MPSITVQFSPELDFFLACQDRGQKITLSIDQRPAVKHPIEALGVPHTEVELICINNQTVTFSERVRDGDVVTVFGHGDAVPTVQSVPLRPPLALPPRFVLDAHLGRLARYLRLLGFDARYANDFDDPTLAAIAAQEGRVLLTRDRGLLKYRCVDHGYCLRTTDPDQQVSDVVRRFTLRPYIVPYSRCLKCNVEMIIDQWNPGQKRYRTETFCYGPKSCPVYKAGPTRKVPGRQGMSWAEEDWVDEDATAHRGPDE